MLRLKRYIQTRFILIMKIGLGIALLIDGYMAEEIWPAVFGCLFLGLACVDGVCGPGLFKWKSNE